MKKGLLVLCAIAISLSVFAQGKGVTYQEVRISKSDSTQSEILNQLIEIRKNQEQEKSARDSIRKSRFNIRQTRQIFLQTSMAPYYVSQIIRLLIQRRKWLGGLLF